jgi:hypothetical protein
MSVGSSRVAGHSTSTTYTEARIGRRRMQDVCDACWLATTPTLTLHQTGTTFLFQKQRHQQVTWHCGLCAMHAIASVTLLVRRARVMIKLANAHVGTCRHAPLHCTTTIAPHQSPSLLHTQTKTRIFTHSTVLVQFFCPFETAPLRQTQTRTPFTCVATVQGKCRVCPSCCASEQAHLVGQSMRCLSPCFATARSPTRTRVRRFAFSSICQNTQGTTQNTHPSRPHG